MRDGAVVSPLRSRLMTAGAPPTADVDRAQAGPPVRRRVLPWAALVLVLVAVAAAAWWWSHPRVFPDGPAGEVATTVEAGTTVYAGMAHVPDAVERDVTVLETYPRDEGPGFRNQVLVCRPRPGESRVGVVTGSLDRWCAEVAEATSEVLRRGDQLVLVLRNDSPATIGIHGVELTYSTGLQRGSQLIGPEVWVEFTEPGSG